MFLARQPVAYVSIFPYKTIKLAFILYVYSCYIFCTHMIVYRYRPRNLKFRYSIQKGLPLAPVLSPMKPFRILMSYF